MRLSELLFQAELWVRVRGGGLRERNYMMRVGFPVALRYGQLLCRIRCKWYVPAVGLGVVLQGQRVIDSASSPDISLGGGGVLSLFFLKSFFG